MPQTRKRVTVHGVQNLNEESDYKKAKTTHKPYPSWGWKKPLHVISPLKKYWHTEQTWYSPGFVFNVSEISNIGIQKFGRVLHLTNVSVRYSLVPNMDNTSDKHIEGYIPSTVMVLQNTKGREPPSLDMFHSNSAVTMLRSEFIKDYRIIHRESFMLYRGQVDQKTNLRVTRNDHVLRDIHIHKGLKNLTFLTASPEDSIPDNAIWMIIFQDYSESLYANWASRITFQEFGPN